MSKAQFVLSVDPAGLRTAADQLEETGRQFDQQAHKLGGMSTSVPISQWQGKARTSVMGEVTALGAQVGKFQERFALAAQRIRKVAIEAEDAVAKVRGMNGAWDDTEATLVQHQKAFDAGEAAANTDLSGHAHAVRQQKLDAAKTDHAQDQARLKAKYTELVDELQSQFSALGRELASLVVAPVSGPEVTRLSKMPLWDQHITGATPGEVDLSTFRSKLPLTRAALALHESQEALQGSEDAEDWNIFLARNGKTAPDPALVRRIEASSGDPAYAHALLTGMGAKNVAKIPDRLKTYYYKNSGTLTTDAELKHTDPEFLAKLVSMRSLNQSVLAGFGRMIAVTSNSPETSPNILSPAWQRDFIAATGEESYAPLAEILQAANVAYKDEPPVFGSDFLNASMNAIIDNTKNPIYVGDQTRSGADAQSATEIARQFYGPYFTSQGEISPLGDNHSRPLKPLTPLLTALAANPHAAATWFSAGVPAQLVGKGHFMSPEATWLLANDAQFTTDDGASLGTALKSGLTAGGSDRDAAARATMAVFHELGTNTGTGHQILLPAGAKSGMRAVAAHWVDALNWNTNYSGTVQINPNDVFGPDEMKHEELPTFTTADVDWVMGQAFTSEDQLGAYTTLAMNRMHEDFVDLARRSTKGDMRATGFLESGATQTGFWLAQLGRTHNGLILATAQSKEDETARKQAWFTFIASVVTSLPVVNEGKQAVIDAANYSVLKVATEKGLSQEMDTGSSALVTFLAPDKGEVKEAQAAGAEHQAVAYDIGRSYIAQWLLEANAIPRDGLTNSSTGKGKYAFLVPRSGGTEGYDVDPAKDPEGWVKFCTNLLKGSGEGNIGFVALRFDSGFNIDPEGKPS